jgi:hypothetical protein
LIVKETRSIAEIKKILCYPEIYKCISDDNSPPLNEFEPPSEAMYVAGYVGSDIIGMMIYHVTEEGLKCHIQVLPEFRKKYAREFARMALEIGEAKNSSIYSEIPICYPNVIRFAKSFGFTETGSIKDGHLLNGEQYDVVILRKEACHT